MDHEDLRRLLWLIQELNAGNRSALPVLRQVQACMEDGSGQGWWAVLRRWMEAWG